MKEIIFEYKEDDFALKTCYTKCPYEETIITNNNDEPQIIMVGSTACSLCRYYNGENGNIVSCDYKEDK